MRAARVTWRQALAWRMARQLLEPVGDLPVEEVVRRLSGVQAQVASSAELAVRLRRTESSAGEVNQALADGRLIKTWANRGALHLLTPEDGGSILALLAAGRSWESPAWQRYFKITPQTIEELRVAAREVLDGKALTREELIEAVGKKPGLKHLAQEMRSGWGTLLKPLAWQGDLVYGPSVGTRVTFTTPETASNHWQPLPHPDEAGPRVVRAYLAAYGPATLDNFRSWLSRPAKKQLRAWFAGADAVALDVEGENAFARQEDVDEMASTRPTHAVRLAGGFDVWTLGPGTSDTHVIPPGRRGAVSRTAGWIAPIVIAGGVVSGTWELAGDTVSVAWFSEIEMPPRWSLHQGVSRLAEVLGRELRVHLVST